MRETQLASFLDPVLRFCKANHQRKIPPCMISDNIVLGRRRLIPLFDPAQSIASAVTAVEKNFNPHVAAEAYVKLLYPTPKPHWGPSLCTSLTQRYRETWPS